MRAKVAALVGFCLVVGGVAGQGDGKGAKQIEGTWLVVSMEKGSKKKDTEGENIRLVIRAGKLTFQKGDDKQEGSYKVDPSKKPKHIDLTVREKEVKGIYEIKKDTLRICAAEEGDARPAEFKVAEDSRAIILTLRREKKKEDK